ncbi:hypothetical protein NQS96_13270 [Pseudoalteromonas shioyasakiensis]|uniref:hypothetical protein n=1 Tax=Pseudoalteromonas shioyasakiensis TaxID=1190813 RepID=UPI00211798F7|nr:hypothetical protein [Pseudoalteromonas shioyasakiensis]MCQ8882745.1 hypothetical protein [Pseudoalteromonas shioyasakiensis]
MKFPLSFKTSNREALNAACQNVYIIGLNSYQTPSLITAAAGSQSLATAVKDMTRQTRPNTFNAVILSCSSAHIDDFINQLTAFNELCPLPIFLHAEQHAKSLVTLDTDNMKLPTTEQSIEWQGLRDCCGITALSHAFVDQSLQLVSDEGVQLISDIDTALNDAAQLKSARNSRLSLSRFKAGPHISITHSNAQSARALGQQIELLGNNDKHWAYCAFVGSTEQITPIKELFS